jgi:hypothetical protein
MARRAAFGSNMFCPNVCTLGQSGVCSNMFVRISGRSDLVRTCFVLTFALLASPGWVRTCFVLTFAILTFQVCFSHLILCL